MRAAQHIERKIGSIPIQQGHAGIAGDQRGYTDQYCEVELELGRPIANIRQAFDQDIGHLFCRNVTPLYLLDRHP